MHHQLRTLHLFEICKPSCYSRHDWPPTIPQVEEWLHFIIFLNLCLSFLILPGWVQFQPRSLLEHFSSPCSLPPSTKDAVQRSHMIPKKAWGTILSRCRTFSGLGTGVRVEVEPGCLASSLLKHPRVVLSEILMPPECCHGWALCPS